MLNQLRQARDEISMEVIATDAAPSGIASKLSNMLEQAAEFLNKSVLQRLGDIFTTKDIAWLALNINRKPYGEMRPLPLVAPQGFKGTLVDYGTTLIKAAEEVDHLEKQVLAPFAAWLSSAIGDPSSVRSITNTLKIPGLQHLNYDAQQKRLNTYFPDKVDTSQPIYGELIRRQADWNELNQQLKKLNTIYANGNFEKVQAKIPDINHLLTVLVTRLNEENSEFQFSSIQTDALSKVTYQIAEQIEFYGVLRHRVDEFVRTVGQNVELTRAAL